MTTHICHKSPPCDDGYLISKLYLMDGWMVVGGAPKFNHPKVGTSWSASVFLLRVAFCSSKGPFSGTKCSQIIPFDFPLRFSHVVAVPDIQESKRAFFCRGECEREAGKGISGS